MSSHIASPSPISMPQQPVPSSASRQRHNSIEDSPTPASSSSSSSSQLPAWHFPFGPSSRYHTRERSQSSLSSQSRNNNYYYASTAPTLVTEIRSHHRRAKSSLPDSTTPVPSQAPPATAVRPVSQQHHGRSPLSRFPSDTSMRTSDSTPSNTPGRRHLRQRSQVNVTAPVTPAKSPPGSSAAMRDSPFSDYFTEESRSIDHALQPNATQQLLVRMSKLQSQLMRTRGNGEHDALTIVDRKLNEIDSELNDLSMHTIPTLPASQSDLLDSGIFLEENESNVPIAKYISEEQPTAEQILAAKTVQPLSAISTSAFPPNLRADLLRYKAERVAFEQKMTLMLHNITKAQYDLRQRYKEVREVNHRARVAIEEKDAEIEDLRSECEGMRSDAGFDLSELLFLKLQMKALEMEVSNSEEGAGGDKEEEEKKEDNIGNATHGQISEEERKVRHAHRRNRILAEMDRWRADWQDVDTKFKRRRASRYGDFESYTSTGDHRRALGARKDLGRGDRVDGSAGEEGVEWQLQTVKEGHGRVTSVTIKRMDSSGFGVRGEKAEGHNQKMESAEEAVGNHDVQPASAIAQGERDQRAVLDIAPDVQSDENRAIAEAEIVASMSSNTAACYVHAGTQTESHTAEADPTLTAYTANDPSPFEEADDREENRRENDECAITTSSEDNNFDDEEENSELISVTRRAATMTKTAWDELWDGLASLTGMGEEIS